MKNILRTDVDFIIKNIFSNGGSFAEIYFQESDVSNITYIDGKVESVSSILGIS